MTTMNAVTFTKGGPDRLTMEVIERPEPGPTEVLVRVTAVGVNPIDWKTRSGGGVYESFDPSLPMVLGWDVAGVVEELGDGVTRFHVGDRVFGMPRFPQPARAYAEFITAPSRQLARIPNGVSDLAAAGVSLSGLTAYQAVVDTLDVGTGSRVLIHGAAGGVGQFAGQIAKARRAEVWATELPGRLSTLKGLGVDHAIDAGAEDFTELATDMDAVLDLVGIDDIPVRSLRSLRPGGRLLVLPSPGMIPSPTQLEGTNVDAQWMLVEPDYAGLEALAAMLGYGLLRVAIAEVQPLASVGTLHALGEAGETIGRLVATVSD